MPLSPTEAQALADLVHQPAPCRATLRARFADLGRPQFSLPLMLALWSTPSAMPTNCSGATMPGRRCSGGWPRWAEPALAWRAQRTRVAPGAAATRVGMIRSQRHYGHVDTVRLLLQSSRIDIDHANRLGWTALLEAIILGDGGAAHTEIVRLLVAQGASVQRADAQGVTPLAHAQARGQRAIVEILRQAGTRP